MTESTFNDSEQETTRIPQGGTLAIFPASAGEFAFPAVVHE